MRFIFCPDRLSIYDKETRRYLPLEAMKVFKPKPQRSYFCPNCKELLLKEYPWSTFSVPEKPPVCGRCLNKGIKPILEQLGRK